MEIGRPVRIRTRNLFQEYEKNIFNRLFLPLPVLRHDRPFSGGRPRQAHFLQARRNLDGQQRRPHQRPRRRHPLRQGNLLLVRGTQGGGRRGQLRPGGRALLFLQGPVQLEGRGNRPEGGGRGQFPPHRQGLHPGTPQSGLQQEDQKVRDVVPSGAQGERLWFRVCGSGDGHQADRAVHVPEGRARQSGQMAPEPGQKGPDHGVHQGNARLRPHHQA